MNDAKVVETVRDNFVPYAANVFDLFYGWAGGKLSHEPAPKWGVKLVGTTDWYVISPEGRQIGFTDQGRSPKAPWSINVPANLITFLEGALKKTEPRPSREIPALRNLTPDHGIGLRKDGTARVAVMSRGFEKGEVQNKIMLLSIILDSKQLDSLRPPRNEKSTRYVLPEEITQRFVRVCGHQTDSYYKILPSHATEYQMDAEVTRAEKNLVEVTFKGDLAARRTHDDGLRVRVEGSGKTQGRLRFDAAGQLQELLLIYNGMCSYPSVHDPYSTKGLIQWRRTPAKQHATDYQ